MHTISFARLVLFPLNINVSVSFSYRCNLDLFVVLVCGIDVRSPYNRQKCNASNYSSRVFDMFTGEITEVELRCQDGMMNYLVDRLGKNVKVTGTFDDGSFTAHIVVEVGPTFLAWVFQFGGLIKIIGPDWVKDKYSKLIESSK